MADKYLKSGAGGSPSGSSWVAAYTTLAEAADSMQAGDRLFVSHQHTESQATLMTVTFPGTPSNPNIILCVNDGATPPTDLATSAVVTTTATGAMTLNGSFYCYGIQFFCGTSGQPALSQNTASANNTQVYEACRFEAASTSSTAANAIVMAGNSTNQRTVYWRNCNVKFGGTGQRIACGANFSWDTGSFLSGSATPALYIFSATAISGPASSRMVISGVDFAQLGSTVDFFNAAALGDGILRDCKLPSGWSGDLFNGTFSAPGPRFEMQNTDYADTNYRFRASDYAGTVDNEGTIVRSGSNSSQSLKMVSSAETSWAAVWLKTPEISRYYDSLSSPLAEITVTVDLVHDSGTNLNNDDIWLDVLYLGTNGVPLGSFSTNKRAHLGSQTALTASSATWNGTGGFGDVNKQKLSVTFMPAEAGYLQARVYLAKASKTVYVDPDLQIS